MKSEGSPPAEGWTDEQEARKADTLGWQREHCGSVEKAHEVVKDDLGEG